MAALGAISLIFSAYGYILIYPTWLQENIVWSFALGGGTLGASVCVHVRTHPLHAWCTRVYTHTICVYKCVRVCMHVCVHIHVHMCMYACVHINIYI